MAFRIPRSAWVEELLFRTEAVAREVRQQLLDGGAFQDFVERSQRENALKKGGRYHFHARDKARFPRLVPAVMEAPVGQIVGPLEVEGGYSVFRVLRWDPEGIQPYEAAQARARILLRREREARGLAMFVQSLRQKYAAQIKVHDAHLQTALPDSLVQG